MGNVDGELDGRVGVDALPRQASAVVSPGRTVTDPGVSTLGAGRWEIVGTYGPPGESSHEPRVGLVVLDPRM